MMSKKKAKTTDDDRAELNRIRRNINDPSHYSRMIEGVHSWDVAKMFEDFRATIQIARRAIKRAECIKL